jgi:hypothetical protein
MAYTARVLALELVPLAWHFPSISLEQNVDVSHERE